MTIYMLIATLAFALLWIGFFLRKNRKLHMRFMLTAIGLDLLMVLILEVQRNVVVKVVSEEMSVFSIGHIVASSLAVILYIPVVILGYKRYKGSQSASLFMTHQYLGKAALGFRTLGFALMFSMV